METKDKRVKREIANSNERRRMQSINAGFQRLKRLLPVDNGEKLSKANILQHAAEFIQQIEREKLLLHEQNTLFRGIIVAVKSGSDASNSAIDSLDLDALPIIPINTTTTTSNNKTISTDTPTATTITLSPSSPNTTNNTTINNTTTNSSFTSNASGYTNNNNTTTNAANNDNIKNNDCSSRSSNGTSGRSSTSSSGGPGALGGASRTSKRNDSTSGQPNTRSSDNRETSSNKHHASTNVNNNNNIVKPETYTKNHEVVISTSDRVPTSPKNGIVQTGTAKAAIALPLEVPYTSETAIDHHHHGVTISGARKLMKIETLTSDPLEPGPKGQTLDTICKAIMEIEGGRVFKE